MRAGVLGSVLGALALLAGLLVEGRQPAPLTGRSAIWLEAGSQDFSERDLLLRDESRPAAAHGEFAGLPYRELRSTVWTPASGTKHPLVVSSHGFSATRHGADYLARALARLGYVVVAPDFPLTNWNAPGGPDIRDVVNQPGDVRFLIDRMLAASGDPADPLAGKIDPDRIAVLGVSLGGLTSTLVGFDARRGDPRVKAVVSLAGPTFPFGAGFYAGRDVPMMLVAGTADALVDYAANALPLLGHLPRSLLVTLRDGSHAGFGQGGEKLRWLDQPDRLICWLVLRKLDPDWPRAFGLLGSADDGILLPEDVRLCEGGRTTRTMNPIRQQWLAQIAVTRFLEAQFSPDRDLRVASWVYLTRTMAREHSDVTVQEAVAR